MTSVSDEYEPAAYWSRRLEGEYTLRGTGHQQYGQGYNRWLYRAKDRALGRALRGVPRAAGALDVGSGTGWVLERLGDRADRVAGCDVAPVAVERLRARFPSAEIELVNLGVDRLPWAAGAFQLATMLDVAYHLTDDDRWCEAIVEVGRVLAPGGRLVVSDRFGEADGRPAPHVLFRSRSHWDSAFGAAGLRLERLVPCFRWLSRDPDVRGFERLPERVRGPLEYAMEWLVPVRAHLRLAVACRA